MKYHLPLIVVGVLAIPSLSFIGHQMQTNFTTSTPDIETRIDAECSSMNGLAKAVCLADAFKATLDKSQLAQLQLPYSKTSATRWSNFPEFSARPRRVGLKFGTLNATQLAAAKALMASVLTKDVPNEGYEELEAGMAADDYFGSVTGKTDVFNSGNYFIAFLGSPSTTKLWELQYGGHHFAFANTYNGGKAMGATPSFRGVEPMSAFTQNGKTYQPMEQERKAFTAMLTSLSSSEQAKAKLSSTFSDILLGPDRDNEFPTNKQGIRVGDLSLEKQKLVLAAAALYVNDLETSTSEVLLNRYQKDLAETYIAFSGDLSVEKVNDYVRIDGPSMWIEYSAQPSRDFPGTSHPHSVWRDRSGDYGGN